MNGIDRSVDGQEDEGGRDGGGWPRMGLWAFRFGVLYFLWIAVPDFATPGQHNSLTLSLDRFAARVGETLLSVGEVSVAPNDSGDRLVSYLKAGTGVALSVVGALVWTLADRGRRHHRRLGRWVVVGARYYLLSVMLGYGFAKVFPVQFRPIPLARLVQPFGEATPMTLLWTFMGFSRPYAVFTGLAEVLGALLLAFRRTTTLGALVVAGVMGHVLMLNLCFDVPVKLYSGHLFLLALALVAIDARRLFAVFVLGRGTEESVPPALFTDPRRRRAAAALKVVVLALLIGQSVLLGIRHSAIGSTGSSEAVPRGIYDVVAFTLDGEVLPPVLTDERRWQALIFDTMGRWSIVGMDGRIEHHSFAVEGGGKLKFYVGDTRLAWELEKPAAGRLRIAGPFDGSELVVELRARDLEEMPLLSREFRWVTEETSEH